METARPFSCLGRQAWARQASSLMHAASPPGCPSVGQKEWRQRLCCPLVFWARPLDRSGHSGGSKPLLAWTRRRYACSVYHRCTRALQGLCTAQPRLLLIDDLHWADSDSLGLLSFLLRRLRDQPLGIIAAMRPWPSEATALAEELEAAGQASVERLSPLGGASAEQVAQRAAGRELYPAELEQLLASCRGNPFLLTQAGAATRARAGSVARGGNPTRQLVARFAGFPPSVLVVAKAASVAGIRFWPRLVGAVAAVDDSTVSFALGALIRAGLAHAQPDGQVEFAHPLFAQALYESIEQPERSRLHGLAMRALLAMGADPAQAAAHAISGHLVADHAAIEALEAAGRAALAMGALDGAVTFLSASVDLAGQLATAKLLLALAEAQLAAGQTTEVKATCQRVLDESPDRSTRVDALVMLARLAWSLDEMDELSERYEEAVAAAEGTDRLVDVLAQAVMVLSKERGPRWTASWSQRLRELGTELSPAQRTEVDLAWGTAAAIAGEAAGSEAIRAALGPANLVSVIRSAAPTAFPLMLAAAFDSRLFVEQFDEADELFAAAWETAERQGALMTLTQLAIIQAAGYWWRGRLAAAHRLLDEMAEIDAAAGRPEAKEQWGIILAMMLVEEGETAAALHEVDKAERLASAGSPWFRTQLWRIRAEVALDAGRTSDAVQLARADARHARATGCFGALLGTVGRHGDGCFPALRVARRGTGSRRALDRVCRSFPAAGRSPWPPRDEPAWPRLAAIFRSRGAPPLRSRAVGRDRPPPAAGPCIALLRPVPSP